MGQFDLETDAALMQLNWEELSKTPGGEFAEVIADLLALTGVAGPTAIAGGASNLLLKIRKLAGASYTSNLIYAITAVRNDLKSLLDRHAELGQRIESLRSDAEFAGAIAALALRAMQTSVKDRLNRLARLVVNGVKENDLEPETLDDMMRAAVELRDEDALVLGRICYQQAEIMMNYGERFGDQWGDEVARSWQAAVHDHSVEKGGTELPYLDWKSSLSRLSALGFIISVPSNPTVNSPKHQPYGLLPQGYKFIQRLRKID